jgi:hypothetical protein
MELGLDERVRHPGADGIVGLGIGRRYGRNHDVWRSPTKA